MLNDGLFWFRHKEMWDRLMVFEQIMQPVFPGRGSDRMILVPAFQSRDNERNRHSRGSDG
jgi:hypothetical protein